MQHVFAQVGSASTSPSERYIAQLFSVGAIRRKEAFDPVWIQASVLTKAPYWSHLQEKGVLNLCSKGCVILPYCSKWDLLG